MSNRAGWPNTGGFETRPYLPSPRPSSVPDAGAGGFATRPYTDSPSRGDVPYPPSPVPSCNMAAAARSTASTILV